MAFAQLTVYPIAHSNPHTSSARQKAFEPLSLPFWDDFSSLAHTDTLWEDKAHIWINSGSAINPPTINVATFDGLDGNGTPYAPNPNQNLDTGPTDIMVSRKIKMTEVSIAEQNSVFLSFYYQWGGFGEAPDPNDYLRLELLNDTGNWIEAFTLRPTDAQEPDQFYYAELRINQNQYFHDDFQFRFQAYGRQSGRFDAWHIDYVYMNKGRTEGSRSIPDRSLYTLLSPAFGSYYAVPVTHLLTQPDQSLYPRFGLSNLEGITQPSNYNYSARVESYKNNSLLQEVSIQLRDYLAILPTMLAYEQRVIETDTLPSISNIDPAADSVVVSNTITLQADDTIRPDFGNIDFRVNDTISTVSILKDFYAYDDGIAEYAVGLTQPGNVAAYRFVMQTPDPDTINGVYVYFPTSYGTFASTVMFYVWDNDNGKPGTILLEELVPVQRNSNNQFVLREFTPSAIVQDTFFIGWRQASGRVLIGLDASNDSGEHLYVNTGGINNPNTWLQNTVLTGSLMIRPRFGPGTVAPVTSTEGRIKKPVALYPNPTKGEFFLEGRAHQLQVLSPSGRPVRIEETEEENKKRIKLVSPLPGLYIVRYFDGHTYQSQKIIIQE